MSEKPSSGKFIVFEGADRSGKTTQTKLCVESLRASGIPVAEGCPWRFPERTTKTGHLIDAYLQDKADMDDRVLHLLFSANRWEKVDRIRQALSAGETVVVDRYAFSGVAYSAAKGLDAEWCKGPDRGLPAPDVVVYLDLPFEAAEKRGEFGAERYEKEDMQRKVAKQFEAMRDERWTVVDADATEAEVAERVMAAIRPVVAAPARSGSLWTE